MKKNKITIVDSKCGDGKTSWAINFMDDNFKDRFIYITPFLPEIKRVRQSTSRSFKEPNEKRGKGSKTRDFINMLEYGDDICSTHALFRNIPERIKQIIEEKEYILILDEVMDVVEQLQISKRDINLLLSDNIIESDADNRVNWIDENYQGEFLKFKTMIKNGDVYLYNDAMILWTFPCDVFKSFKHVYILTYMFDGQIQKYYYDLNKLEYEYKSVKYIGSEGFGTMERKSYALIDYVKPDLSKYKELINIYDGKLNNIGEDYNSFSVSWLSKNKGTPTMKRIKDNTVNYFKNITKTKLNDNMWTTFLDYKKSLQGKGYTKGFIDCGARATNEYRHKKSLVYLCNRFYNPIMKNFFLSKGIFIDEDVWALSELIQWLFRSQIREGKPINIYIPSSRMRNLLIKWLE